MLVSKEWRVWRVSWMLLKRQIYLTAIIVSVIQLATADVQSVTGATLGYMRKPAGNNKIKRLLRAPRWSPVRPKVQSETVCAPSRSACSPKVRGQTRSLPRSSPRATNRRPPLSGGREPREEWSRWNGLKLKRLVGLEPLQNEKVNKWTKAIIWRFPISCNKTSSSFIFVWIGGARISLHEASWSKMRPPCWPMPPRGSQATHRGVRTIWGNTIFHTALSHCSFAPKNTITPLNKYKKKTAHRHTMPVL